MTIAELLDGLAEVAAPLADQPLTGLSLDSRQVRPGHAFLALGGATTHGLAHARSALENGARCVIFEAPAPAGVVVADDWLPVPALRSRLAELARRFFDSPAAALRVIGVTGTNGKTSTVQLLAQAMDRAGLGPCGHLGTLGLGVGDWLRPGERTTPDVLAVHAALADLRRHGARALAMEVSSHALDQGRVDGVSFALAVFTNLTRDHLDYHGDMQAYGAAKARLFHDWPLRAAVINIDDAFGAQLLTTLASTIDAWPVSAAGAAAARLRAQAIVLDAGGLGFELCEGSQRIEVRSRLIGRFNVDNLLAVAAALRAQGVALDLLADLLGQLQPVRGRMQRINPADSGPLVVVDYAHTPDALQQALASLRGHTRGRLIGVFGCGGDRDRGKRPLMAAVAEQAADRLILTDDNPRGESGDAIIDAIRAGLRQPQRAAVQRDRAAAIRQAIAEAADSDTVLIAGKGHESYQETAGERRPFDDAVEARRCLEARA